MQPQQFIDRHRPALEADEPRYNLILAILDRLLAAPELGIRYWDLAEAGECAVQSPSFPIVLGSLKTAACHELADLTQELDYPGVVGNDMTAVHFVEHARALGLHFAEPIPQTIYALREAPRYPGTVGSARVVVPDDGPLLADWLTAFYREAVPHDTVPARDKLTAVAAEGRHLFWIVDSRPVSLAGIQRRTRSAAAIATVYIPPEFRGRGYGGSVTAAVVERIFAEGRKAACLYTDLRNRFSNRCYVKIGFRPVCSSYHYLKTPSG